MVPPATTVVPVRSDDGAASELLLVAAPRPHALLVWLPALGVPARAYRAFAETLAARGVSVLIHEWRGIGSSSIRASHGVDWGYRELLQFDLPGTARAMASRSGRLPVYWGGHSLGGQLASLHMARNPGHGAGLVLVGSGAPFWRVQRRRIATALLAAMAVVPALTRLAGHLPGRRIGFGGREARGVMRDWLRCVRTGRYRAGGLDEDLEEALAALDCPVLGVTLADDLFGPRAALEYLLDKTACKDRTQVEITPQELGAPADHFSWMQTPSVVSAWVMQWLNAHCDR